MAVVSMKALLEVLMLAALIPSMHAASGRSLLTSSDLMANNLADLLTKIAASSKDTQIKQLTKLAQNCEATGLTCANDLQTWQQRQVACDAGLQQAQGALATEKQARKSLESSLVYIQVNLKSCANDKQQAEDDRDDCKVDLVKSLKDKDQCSDDKAAAATKCKDDVKRAKQDAQVQCDSEKTEQSKRAAQELADKMKEKDDTCAAAKSRDSEAARSALQATQQKLADTQTLLAQANKDLAVKNSVLAEKDLALQKSQTALLASQDEVSRLQAKLAQQESTLSDTKKHAQQLAAQLVDVQEQLTEAKEDAQDVLSHQRSALEAIKMLKDILDQQNSPTGMFAKLHEQLLQFKDDFDKYAEIKYDVDGVNAALQEPDIIEGAVE